MTPEQMQEIKDTIKAHGVQSFPGGEINGSVWQTLIRTKADTVAIRAAVGALDTVDTAQLAQDLIDAGLADQVVAQIKTLQFKAV